MSDEKNELDDDARAGAGAELPDADTVTVAEAEVSPDALEPDLTTTAAGLRLAEPTLGPAVISDDAAASASLAEAAAEASTVEQQAEEAGVLAAGPRTPDDPATAMVPEGTAPAGGPAGDVIPLTGFGAAGDAPAWTREDADSQRWDELFADQPAPAESGHTLSSAAVGLPPGIAAPPTRRPGTGARADEDAEGEPTLASDAGAAGDSAGPFSAKSPASPADGPAQPPDAGPAQQTGQPWPGNHPPSPPTPGGPYGLPPAGVVPAAPLEPPGPETHGQPLQRHQAPDPRTGSRRAQARAGSGSSAGKGGPGKALLIAVAVGLVILALLIWAVINIVNAVGRAASEPTGSTTRSAAATAGADGIIAEAVAPLDLAAGDCLLDFVDANTEVTVVTCATPHNAQLLASDFYNDDAEYPGDAELAARAQAVCDGVDLDQQAAGGIAIQSVTVTPTTASWADGDRRLDCFAVAEDGNVLSDSLLAR